MHTVLSRSRLGRGYAPADMNDPFTFSSATNPIEMASL
jgi:hypothetical protein